ncbi:hypothetical protein AGMMS50212_05550 [Spirochaetia bacterium]|nr:hypothetical protein AGMMS50212_05550 [Spirochaetia bacterium]
MQKQTDRLQIAIEQFIFQERTANEYIEFTHNIFKKTLSIGDADPIWDLLEHLKTKTDFYTAPASTHFHGAEPGGLVRHSLLVAANGIKLAPVMLSGKIDMYYLIISCLFHDFCKVNMYEIKTRNVKNEKTNKWEEAPYYSIRNDYLSYGHGIESMLRINEFIKMPDSWNHAIRWHMGAYDSSTLDKYALKKALSTYKEVLLLQTADMQAGMVEEV